MTTESGLIIPDHVSQELLIPTHQNELVIPPHVQHDDLSHRAPELMFGEMVEVEGEGERFRILEPLHDHSLFATTHEHLFDSSSGETDNNEKAPPEVYVADDTETGERVALKILYEPNDTATALVDRELAAHAILTGQHGFVETVDMGILEKDDGRHRFVATKLNAEGTLGDKLKKEGPLDPHDALVVGIQVVSLAVKMNEQGFVHGDIKPDNILMTPDEVELTDMGTVRIAQEKRRKIAQQMGMSDLIKPLAAVGTGSRGYAAPESIVNPDAIDTRTDTFGTSATVYSALTRTTPFASSSLEEYIRRTQEEPLISAHMHNSNVPVALSAVLREGLDPQQENRPTPTELRSAFVDLQDKLAA